MDKKWFSSRPWDEAYRSGDYLKSWDYSHPSQELVATVAALNLPKGSVALDLGCGGGREAVFLAQCGYRVYGIDFSKQALKVGKRRASMAGVSVKWRQADVKELPLPAACLDFVNDRGCFHLIPSRGRSRMARELARVMKSGAHLLLRGSSCVGREGFIPVNQRALRHFFRESQFIIGRVLPITMIANVGSLSANLAILRRL